MNVRNQRQTLRHHFHQVYGNIKANLQILMQPILTAPIFTTYYPSHQDYLGQKHQIVMEIKVEISIFATHFKELPFSTLSLDHFQCPFRLFCSSDL